jgi:hypothetical protein
MLVEERISPDNRSDQVTKQYRIVRSCIYITMMIHIPYSLISDGNVHLSLHVVVEVICKFTNPSQTQKSNPTTSRCYRKQYAMLTDLHL